MKFQFYLRFYTEFGQSLWLSGNIDELGNDDPARAFPMEYLDNEFWTARIEINKNNFPKHGISYNYFMKTKEGEIIHEWGRDRIVGQFRKDLNEITAVDTWNHAGEYENSFYTTPFKEVLLKLPPVKTKAKAAKDFTHLFKVK